MMKKLICSALALLMAAPALAADKQNDWHNLASIPSDSKVEVVRMNLSKVSGRFVGFTAADVTIHSQAGEEIIPRANVARVSGEPRIARWGLMAGLAAAGMVTGAAIGYGVQRKSQTGTAVGLLVGTAGGAIAGALVPLPKVTTYYRAEKTGPGTSVR